MTMTAIISARFSNYEQREGVTLARQIGDCRAMCAARGWPVEGEPLKDEGKSAFTGANRSEGAALGQFEAEARDGLHIGKVLVVERLDRLSREGYDATYRLVTALMDAGVSVATVDGNELYLAGTKLSLLQLMPMMIKAEMAHEESSKKSQRVRDAKARHREAARTSGRIFTASGPPWLEVKGTGDARRWQTIPSRVRTVESIFRMAEGGAGKTTLERHWNEVEPAGWGKGKRGGKGWHESFFGRLLSNRAVLGEYQPHEWIDGKRVPSGEPIQGYYPAIIDADLFARVNREAPARKEVSGGRNGAVKLANLVSGLAKCGECGASMRYRPRSSAGAVRKVNGKPYIRHHADASLVCSVAKRALKSRCTNRAGIAYHSFEKALLGSILHIALDDQAFSNRGEIGRLSRTIAERQRSLDLAGKRAQALWSAYADAPSEMAMKLARAAEAEAETLVENLAALERQRDEAKGRASSAEHLARVADLRDNLYHPDLTIRVPLRRKVAQALRAVVTSITCDADRVATVVLAGGLAALQIERGKVTRQANAVRAFADANFSSLVARDGANASAIPSVMQRLSKTLIDNGSLAPDWRERRMETLKLIARAK